MTLEERNELREVSEKLSDLKSAVDAHIARSTEIERRWLDLAIDVYGVPGDIAKPGLMGRVLLIERERTIEARQREAEQSGQKSIVMTWQGWLSLAAAAICAFATVAMAWKKP
jgi:hypothetical protein